MKYIQIIFTVAFLGNNCFASINFHDDQKILELKSRIAQLYPGKNISEKINTLKQWQNKISDGNLSFYCYSLQNDDLPLIEILLKHNNVEFFDIRGNHLTSFYGTGLNSLTKLDLRHNRLTSFYGTGLSALTVLELGNNQLTSFDGTGLSALTVLELGDNQLTSFDGTGLHSLTSLCLEDNYLPSFDSSGLNTLLELDLSHNQLTSFDGKNLGRLTSIKLSRHRLIRFDGIGLNSLRTLNLDGSTLTSFDGRGLNSLLELDLEGNKLISFDGRGLNSLLELDLEGNKLISFDGTGLISLQDLDLSDNKLTSFNGTGLNSLTSLCLYGQRLTSFEATGLFALERIFYFSWAPNTLVPQLRIDCERDGLNDLVRQQMINALGESNNYAHQALGYDLAATYLGQHHGLASLSPEEFNVDIIKNLSTPLPEVAISDEAKTYWMNALGGPCVGNPELRRETMISHIFVQALDDNPQDNGIWNLPANACEPAALILTAIYEHFQNNLDRVKEHECIGRLTDAFDYCQANQAPTIMHQIDLLGLSPLPDLSTVSGFINYHIIRFKQQCAGRVIESEGINVDVDAHQYGLVTSILNGLFNTGCTLQGYKETSRATEDEIARYSSCYVSHFTKESLIEYFEEELNQLKNCRLRTRLMRGESQYNRLINDFFNRMKKHGQVNWSGKQYTDIDSFIIDMYGDREVSVELVERLLTKEGILV